VFNVFTYSDEHCVGVINVTAFSNVYELDRLYDVEFIENM